jgi:hypothetical protein
VLSHDIVLPLLLQSDSGLSCNRCTLRVANTKFFRLILHPFCWIVVQVAIDIHSEFQILSFQGFHLVSGLHYIFFLFYDIVIYIFLFDDTITSLPPKL